MRQEKQSVSSIWIRLCLALLQMILAILFVLEQVLRWKMSRIFQRYPVIFIFLMYMRGDLLKDVEEH